MNPEHEQSGGRFPSDWLDAAGHKRLVLAALSLRQRRRRRRQSVLAGVALLVLGITASQNIQLDPVRAETTALRNALSRERLPDGSVIEWRGPVSYTLDFSGGTRRVRLARGTAHFDVTKDPARPFIVTAHGVDVRAVGTSFSVELGRDAVEVLVTEGRVAVAAPPGSGVAPATVDAGDGVRVGLMAVKSNQAPVIQAVAPAAFEQKLAWRVRTVEFSSTPLAEAIAILNAENRVQFTLADPTLANVKLSGLMRADRIQGVVRLLEEEFGVQAEWRGDTEIILRRGANPAR